MQPKDNVARNISFPIQETRCMQREMRSHETPLYAILCFYILFYLAAMGLRLILHTTAVHSVRPPTQE